MKIAIIGAGFYGCYLAKKLSNNHEVHIFESKEKMCMAAIVNNQNRLHLGYHYPRSNETVLQIISSYNKFLEEFRDCVSFIPQNIYAVHKDSNVDFEYYSNFFNSYNLDHREVLKSDKIWDKIKNPKDFQGAFYTSEGILDTNKLRLKVTEPIYSSKNIKISCNHKVDDNEVDILRNEFDYVINCTYNDPYIGFESPPVDVKKEHCLIVVMKDSNYRDFGFAVMDGNFCSLYPIKGDIFSLSSVVHTPFSKNELSSFDVKENLEKIISDGERYFLFKERKIVDYYFGTKTKIKNDLNDERETLVLKEGNLLSVLIGKISTIFYSIDEVEKEIYK